MTRRVKRLAFLTGKRGGYEAMVPTLQELGKARIRVDILTTDQHFFEEFGKTFQGIAWPNHFEIELSTYIDRAWDRLSVMGLLMHKLATHLDEQRPDMLMLIGDRCESLMGAIAAHNLRIPIAHVQGGDVTGGVDDAQRHAITKLSHLHFVSTHDASMRVQRMGEQDWRVHVVGDPHIDQIKLGWMAKEWPPPTWPENFEYDEKYLIVLYHPDTLHPERTAEEFAAIKRGVLDSEIKPIWVFPCTDQGFQTIIDQLDGLENVHRNIPSRNFLTLLKHAVCIVGNSSCGLIEAPYFGTPALNVGSRQWGRAAVGNVVNVQSSPTMIHEVIATVAKRGHCDPISPFGNGTAYKQITKVLTELKITDEFLDKRIKY